MQDYLASFFICIYLAQIDKTQSNPAQFLVGVLKSKSC